MHHSLEFTAKNCNFCAYSNIIQNGMPLNFWRDLRVFFNIYQVTPKGIPQKAWEDQEIIRGGIYFDWGLIPSVNVRELDYGI